MREPRLRARGLPPVLSFNMAALSVAEGVRAGLAIAVVVVLHQWLEWPGLMETALAAQLACLCDSGGPVRQRVAAILVFSVAGAAITAAFGILRDVPAVAWGLASATVFACSYVRVFGPAAMQVGNLLTVVLALALRDRGPAAADAPLVGAMFLAGGLWALLMTAVIWQVRPYRPARVAVAHVLRALAAMAADMREAAAVAQEARWDHHARAHRHAVRAALETARAAVLVTVRSRGPASGPAAQSWLRLEATDQLFGVLIALSELLAETPAPTRAAADRLLRLLPPILRLLERAVVADAVAMRPGLDRAIGAIPAVVRDNPTLRPLAEAIAERLRAALSPTVGPDRLPIAAPPPRWRDVVALHRSWRSDTVRHAARSTALASLAFAAMLIWPRPYLHWFAITVVLTLQPTVATTVVRAAERVGGTVLGGLLAAAIGLVAATPLAIAAAVVPLSVLALSLRAVSFGLFMAALTPEIVLLSEIGQPGTDEWRIALLRALLTAAGGATALAAAVVLWPSWEPQRLAAQLREAVAAHGRYALASVALRLGEAEPAAVDAARRAAGAASNAFEATLQRRLLERSVTRRGTVELEALLTVDAALRRLAGRLSALALASPDATPQAAWRALRGWLVAATDRLQEGASLPPRPPELEAAGADGPLQRLARPLELAAGALRRLSA